MHYEKRFHLYNSRGVWIGFCLGSDVFDTFGIWRAWFAWEESADAMTPQGTYLGTVVGNRFYSFSEKTDLHIGYYPSFPTIPTWPESPRAAVPNRLPNGAADVKLRPARLRDPSRDCPLTGQMKEVAAPGASVSEAA
jgi:hypothetical protein